MPLRHIPDRSSDSPSIELLAQARSGRHYLITQVVTLMARDRFDEAGLSEGDEIACVENHRGSMQLERSDGGRVSLERDYAWFAQVQPVGVGHSHSSGSATDAVIGPIGLGDEAPEFVVETTQGTIHFPEWKRGHWALLVSYPGDFTPVCTTELAALAALSPDFEQRRTKVMAIGADPLGLHQSWLSDIERLAGRPVAFPIAADTDRWVSRLYGGRDAARSTWIVDPDNRVRLMTAYPDCTGRDFREILRVIDSLQLAARHGVATPAGWQQGRDVVIPADMPTDEAERRFGREIELRAPYLRTTSRPDVTSNRVA